MLTSTTYLILFAANLAFILTNLYGWLLKWFYRPKAYNDHFHELFPAQRSVGVLYLLQIFELPYLLQIGNANALLFVNAFSVLIFSLQMLVMCEGYFFPKNIRTLKYLWRYTPAVIILAPLFLQAVHVITLPKPFRPWVFVAVFMVFAVYFWWSVRMAQKIGCSIRMINEASFADSEDFPLRFAQYIQWVPTAICMFMILNFCLDDPVVKAIRDVIFTFVNIWFCIFTLNPWRKVFSTREAEIINEMGQIGPSTFRLSDERYNDLSRRLDDLLQREHIFTESHITIDTLMSRLGTNSKYIAEVIKRSGYQSFYDMICQHRVRHAISLIHQNPNEKLLVIAEACGFSSPASMTKAFKSQGKSAPSAYKHT